MTALDPTPIVRELEEEWNALGQYRPETVRRLCSLVTATNEIEIYPRADRSARPSWAGPSPVPRGGRTTWPAGESARPWQVIPFPGLCGVKGRFFCGEAKGHEPSPHVAYGAHGRVMDEWPSDPPSGDPA